MTKGELKYLIFQQVLGGEGSTDSSVWETDLDLPIVYYINEVMRSIYFQDLKYEDGDRVIEQQLIQVAPAVPILFDSARIRNYSVLPFKLISLPKGRALTFVGLPSGKSFIPAQQNEQDLEQYFSKFKFEQVTYYLEGQNIYYYNLPEIQKPKVVLMKALVEISSLNDTDTILLPSDHISTVVNLVTDYVTKQRQNPKDIQEDREDVTVFNKK